MQAILQMLVWLGTPIRNLERRIDGHLPMRWWVWPVGIAYMIAALGAIVLIFAIVQVLS